MSDFVWPFPADFSRGWPFQSVNGVRTPESIALAQMPTPPKPTPHEICQSTQPEDALI